MSAPEPPKRVDILGTGSVETALAIREGDVPVNATNGSELCSILLQADAIFVPDIKTSTAGIHVVKVLKQLGIANEVASRLQIHPNGATAMRFLARTDARKPIGCTQSAEIIATSGVQLCGPLTLGFDLATMYTAAVTRSAQFADAAKKLIDVLTAAEARSERSRVGFAEKPK